MEDNYFLIRDQFYVKKGHRYGFKCGPPYANTYMISFQDKYVYSHPLFIKHGLVWLPFIDDIYCIWSGGPEHTLTDFVMYLNNVYPELGFTLHYSKRKSAFEIS